MRRFFLFAAVCGVVLACCGQTKAVRADRIVIVKSAHTMTLMHGGREIRIYKVALGDPKGPKEQRGDKKTPEGLYFVDGKNAHSLFHRALHLSYPSAADRERARKSGCEPGRGH